MANLEKLHYAPTHEWISVAQEGGDWVGTVGITAFAVQQLTDLVFMALPSKGKAVKAGQEFGEVESVKAVSPLYSPVDGEVIDVNQDLANHLETLTTDPYDAGWMIKIKVSDPSQLQGLLDYAAYQKQCAESH
jgi:glycine cleavage system H protein